MKGEPLLGVCGDNLLESLDYILDPAPDIGSKIPGARQWNRRRDAKAELGTPRPALPNFRIYSIPPAMRDEERCASGERHPYGPVRHARRGPQEIDNDPTLCTIEVPRHGETPPLFEQAHNPQHFAGPGEVQAVGGAQVAHKPQNTFIPHVFDQQDEAVLRIQHGNLHQDLQVPHVWEDEDGPGPRARRFFSVLNTLYV